MASVCGPRPVPGRSSRDCTVELEFSRRFLRFAPAARRGRRAVRGSLDRDRSPVAAAAIARGELEFSRRSLRFAPATRRGRRAVRTVLAQGPICCFAPFELRSAPVTKLRPLISIVDDEESIRKALTRLLRSAGMDVETFPSGVEFLESLPIRRPDCVVLDLHMPGMNGFEVQARLAEFSAPVPVVIITGHDSNETRDRALAGRPMAYLRKPVNDQTLLDAIELALTHNPGP